MSGGLKRRFRSLVWRWIAILCTAFLLPYTVTLAWSGTARGFVSQETASGGRRIYLDGMSEAEDPAFSNQLAGVSAIGGYVDAEEYLIGVVARQIPMEYEPEALKAQAIVARTWLYRQMDGRKEITASELDEGSYGRTEEWAEGNRNRLTEDGMNETLWDERHLAEYYEKARQARLVICCDGKLIEPLYHAVSAGRTRQGDSACPYLQAVDSSADLEAESFLTVNEWTEEEFATLVTSYSNSKGYSIGFSTDSDQLADTLQLISRDVSGYVTEYQIGSHSYTGDEVREMLSLPSSAFTLNEYSGRIRAVCQGQGHGLGLSQYGANRLALDGQSAEEILHYYYHGITVEEAE